jgi:hypothetical protein
MQSYRSILSSWKQVLEDQEFSGIQQLELIEQVWRLAKIGASQ